VSGLQVVVLQHTGAVSGLQVVVLQHTSTVSGLQVVVLQHAGAAFSSYVLTVKYIRVGQHRKYVTKCYQELQSGRPFATAVILVEH
jgi:hypothetical protein